MLIIRRLLTDSGTARIPDAWLPFTTNRKRVYCPCPAQAVFDPAFGGKVVKMEFSAYYIMRCGKIATNRLFCILRMGREGFVLEAFGFGSSFLFGGDEDGYGALVCAWGGCYGSVFKDLSIIEKIKGYCWCKAVKLLSCRMRKQLPCLNFRLHYSFMINWRSEGEVVQLVRAHDL